MENPGPTVLKIYSYPAIPVGQRLGWAFPAPIISREVLLRSWAGRCMDPVLRQPVFLTPPRWTVGIPGRLSLEWPEQGAFSRLEG